MGAGSSTNNDKNNKGLDVMRVSSGFRSEKSAFTWKIENFDVVRQSKEQICAQKFEFNVGEKIGLPCTMSCCLHYVEPNPAEEDVNVNGIAGTDDDGVKKWIGLYYNLVQSPQSAAHCNTAMQIEIYNKHGQKFLSLDGGVADLVNKQGWGFPQVLSKDARVEQLPLIDGSLTITIKFTIFAPNPTTTQEGAMMQIRKMESGTIGASKSIYNLVRDYNNMFKLANQNQNEESKGYSDVKIFSKDGQVVKAHRAILAARSPVFEAMFRNNLSEAETGIVRIPDISGPTLNIVLQYIYTGTLPNNWCKPEVVVELTNAAAKYELKDLLEYLDWKLGKVCDEQTAGKLLLLANRLQLRKAEKQILEYIKQHGVTKSKDFIAIVKHIADNDNEVPPSS